MGREIEIKVPLSKDQYKKILDMIFYKNETGTEILVSRINGKKGNPNLVIKKDEYYSRFNSREERLAAKEPQVIRIRSEEVEGESKSFFTLKYKNRQNGIELNQEDETYIENPEVLREFFSEAGYKLWFEKFKKAYGAYCSFSKAPGIEFHVELESVNNLFYIEVEVTQDEGEADKIKASLNDFIFELGLDPEKRDIRSWVEILK